MQIASGTYQHELEIYANPGGVHPGHFVGLEEERSPISIYPNPVRDVLNLELQEEAEILLYSSQGRELRRDRGVGKFAFDLGELETGIYLMKVRRFDGQLETHKILKH